MTTSMSSLKVEGQSRALYPDELCMEMCRGFRESRSSTMPRASTAGAEPLGGAAATEAALRSFLVAALTSARALMSRARASESLFSEALSREVQPSQVSSTWSPPRSRRKAATAEVSPSRAAAQRKNSSETAMGATARSASPVKEHQWPQPGSDEESGLAQPSRSGSDSVLAAGDGACSLGAGAEGGEGGRASTPVGPSPISSRVELNRIDSN